MNPSLDWTPSPTGPWHETLPVQVRQPVLDWLARAADVQSAARTVPASTVPASTVPASTVQSASTGPVAHPALPDGWDWQRDALGGGALWQRAPRARRLWLQVDRYGRAHTVAAWREGALESARFLLPDGQWLELAADAANHPVWSRCDVLRAACPAGPPLAVLPRQDYARLSALPALDRPHSLPAGGGAAVLNFLARLAQEQGRTRLHYRGPFPTAQLFEALCRSFDPWPAAGGPAAAREEFSQHEDSLALAAQESLPENSLPWRPRAFLAVQPHPHVLVHWRPAEQDGAAIGPSDRHDATPGAPQTVWLHGVPFRAGTAPAPQAGSRLWPDPATPDEWQAGLRLLGAPYQVFARLDVRGGLIAFDPLVLPWSAGPALSAPWHAAVLAWATLQSTPLLAATVAELGPSMQLRWAHLPLSMVEPLPDGAGIAVQAGVVAQFSRLSAAQPRGGHAPLALMALSDVLAGTAPLIKRLAQQAVAAQRPALQREDWARRAAGGRQAHLAAREQLERATPALVRNICAGTAWPGHI